MRTVRLADTDWLDWVLLELLNGTDAPLRHSSQGPSRYRTGHTSYLIGGNQWSSAGFGFDAIRSFHAISTSPMPGRIVAVILAHTPHPRPRLCAVT